MSTLVERLHRLRRLAEPRPGERAASIVDRLDRDLLPRTRFGDDWLVCAIVGPNNAGKSALFNGLCGSDLSPSLPTGAATRRLVATARPELVRVLMADSAGGRFEVSEWLDSAQALVSPERPEQVLLRATSTCPEQVLLIDAPDFDSIEERNRSAAQAVLATADLAVCVVTKHTYQNAHVVQFLEHWLAGGRPWIAVYNEYPTAAIARSHLDKLAADIGSAPIARFGAPHDNAVADGTRPLRVESLDGQGASLAELLSATGTRGAWKRAALEASLGQLEDDVRALIDELTDTARRHSDVRAIVVEHTRGMAESVAAQAMPAQPFLAAFTAVIDRRRNTLRRRWHGAVRALSIAPIAMARALGRRSRTPAPVTAGLLELERAALAERSGPLQEELSRLVGPASVEHTVDPIVRQALDVDLARSSEQALAQILAAHGRAPVDVASFQAICEGLVEHAIAERGHDRDIQAFMDLATLLPVAAAAATVFLTGGFAVDMAIASSGVVTTALLERYSHFFDRGIAREARASWRRSRGAELGTVIASALLPTAWTPLDERADESAEAALALQQWLQET